MFGKMICAKCGKDCTGGLWAPGLLTRGTLTERQSQDLQEFKKKFGIDHLILCWSCYAETMGVESLSEKTHVPENGMVKK